MAVRDIIRGRNCSYYAIWIHHPGLTADANPYPFVSREAIVGENLSGYSKTEADMT